MININNNNNDHFPHTHRRNVVWIEDQSLLLGEESLRQPVTSHHESNDLSSVLREPGDGHQGYHCGENYHLSRWLPVYTNPNPPTLKAKS